MPTNFPGPARDTWQRCGWTLSLAIAISLCLLWIGGYSLNQALPRQAENPLPVELHLIEEVPKYPAATVPRVATLPAAIHVPHPMRQPQARQLQTSPAATPVQAVTTRDTPGMTGKPISTMPAAHESAANSSNSQHEISGARAMIQPRPLIPDDLRQEILNTSCIARFHIAADGTAHVELLRPSSSPRLNRLLLDTLSEWRFFPAMKDGQPVASTEDIVFKVDVH